VPVVVPACHDTRQRTRRPRPGSVRADAIHSAG
jgi:hypothetical protein